MIYPQKLNSRKSNLIVKLGLSISLIVAITLSIINRLTTPHIPWAAIANAGIIYIWIVNVIIIIILVCIIRINIILMRIILINIIHIIFLIYICGINSELPSLIR